jgi:hypothetical protein
MEGTMSVFIKRMSKREIRFIVDDTNEGPHNRDEAEYLIGETPAHHPVPVLVKPDERFEEYLFDRDQPYEV